jgi:hypothetical protein
MPTVVEFAKGKGAGGSLVVLGADIVASTGEDEAVDDADIFDRLW